MYQAITTDLPASTRLPKAGFGGAARKTALLLFSVAALLAGGAAAARAQSALDGFDPNANGAIHIVVAQSGEGQILIAGDFTALAPNGGAAVTRNLFARLNPDGTLDTNFNPNPDGQILSIAVQVDGKILVGGNFASIGGQSRHRIARLDATTGAADSFDPNPAGDVYAVAVQRNNGKILAGGAFTSIGGQPRNNIARLDPITGLADSFDPNAQGVVQSIMEQPDGGILVGGTFAGANSIGGATRNYIARLDPTTGLADSFDPNANGIVRSIAVQADGKIIVGGQFNFIGGQTRNYIARLDPATGAADAFNPNANNQVFTIAIQPDGKILAGGFFNGTNSIGGQTRNYLARLDEITGLADSFDPNVTGAIIFAIAVQQDGKVVAGGNFTAFSPNGGTPVTRNNIARLEKDGLLDRTLDLNIVGNQVIAIAIQPDGKFLIGGIFTSVLGVARNNIARLHTDGTLDTAFNPNANGTVHSIVVQGDGQILVGGEFQGTNSIGGAERNCIARLNGVTGAADSFNPKIDTNGIPTVFSMALQADDNILVCGTFTNINGQTRNYLARLNPDGTLDAGFNPNPDANVGAIALQNDGKILAGGEFTQIGGQPRNHIARLDPITGLADSLDPNADNVVSSIVAAFRDFFVGGSFTNIGGLTKSYFAGFDRNGSVLFPDGSNVDDLVFSIAPQAGFAFLLGGQFSHIGTASHNFICRILPLGNDVADSFDPDASNTVSSLALQADGKILVSGQFNGTNSIGGQTRSYFARLNNNYSAGQQILIFRRYGAFPDVIFWQVDGSNPEFSRVTFEYSTNKVNYSFLGNGAEESPLEWSLGDPVRTNLNLPTGQNIYIRARGYYSTGYANGSESIEESVQIAFFPTLPPLLNIQLSANTNVVLSWPTNFTGFTLESNTNLNTTNWSAVSPASAISGTNNVVTNAASGLTRFYRLRK